MRGRYGLSIAYSSACELSGRGGGGFLQNLEGPLGKVETTRTAPWASNKQQSLITKYTCYKPDECMWISMQKKTHAHTHTHIQFPSFVVSAAKLLFPFSAGCFYLSALYRSPLMKGSM